MHVDGEENRRLEFRTKAVLSRILKFNYHRLVLGIFMLIIGSTVVGIVYTPKPDSLFVRSTFGPTSITIIVFALAMLLFWFKIKKVVQALITAIDTYSLQFLSDSSQARLTGPAMSRTRIAVMCVGSVIGVLTNIGFIITQSIALSKACKKLSADSATSNTGSLSFDQALIGLTATVVVGACICLFSVIQGTYTVILLCGKLRCRVKLVYPLAIYRDLVDMKPVYLH